MNVTEPNVGHYRKSATPYSVALDESYCTRKDVITTRLLGTRLLGIFKPLTEKMKINPAFGKAMFQAYSTEGYANIFGIGVGPMPKAHELPLWSRCLYIDNNPEIVAHAPQMPAWQWLGLPPSKSAACIWFDLSAMRFIKR